MTVVKLMQLIIPMSDSWTEPRMTNGMTNYAINYNKNYLLH